MDAVILAAGRGTRLEGVAAPYHKPLMVVNGKPIITQAVDIALARVSGDVVIVVAPDNASPISHVLGRRDCVMIVQRFPDGPGDALSEGLRVGNSKKALVLMGDNVFDPADIEKILMPAKPAVGVRRMALEEARRFTYLNRDGNWVEDGEPDSRDANDGWITTWCGPLVVDSSRAYRALRHKRAHQELKIGPRLNEMLGDDWVQVESHAIDIGVPEALT